MTDQELDRTLDAGLATYAGEPSPGLERRVRVRVRRPRGWWYASAAIAAAVLAFVAMPDTARVPPPPLVASTPAVPVFSPAIVPRPIVRGKAKPAGIPLSAQEQQLEKLMQAFPQLAKQLETTPQDLSKPVTVPSLEFAPITIEPLETNAPGVN